MAEKVILFTDGSSTVVMDEKKMKYGGIGIYCVNYDVCVFSKSYVGTDITNQRMELLACIEAIKKVYDFMVSKYTCKLWEIKIYTDSMYVIDSMEKYAPKWILYGWHRCVNKKRVEISNLDLIKELYILYKTLPITFAHIESHTKEPEKNTEKWDLWYGNKMADKLAVNAMKSGK